MPGFSIKLSLRVILLFLSLCLLTWLISRTNLFFSAIICGLIIILLLWETIHFVNKANRKVARFLTSIACDDFSYNFGEGKEGESFQELGLAFREITQKFQVLRIRKEEQFLFIQTLLEHVPIGLIVFKQEGQVIMMNASAKKLLHLPHLLHIQSLDKIQKGLGSELLQIQPSSRKIIKLVREEEYLQLIVNASIFRIGDEKQTLISIQHIGKELQENEVESWQKLIRVLTHEIMNSITPIMSLAGTAGTMLREAEEEQKSLVEEAELMEDLKEALHTIESRSRGMLSFVQAYRKLNRLPQPEFQEVMIRDVFSNTRQLLKTEITALNIRLLMNCDPPNLKIYADAELLEQVLINLSLNAIEAVKNRPDPEILFRAFLNHNGDIFLAIRDNGKGILPENIDKIFIPFFTTRDEGSGIGLSLCRQIIRAHSGELSVVSEEGKGAEFFIRLPQ